MSTNTRRKFLAGAAGASALAFPMIAKGQTTPINMRFQSISSDWGSGATDNDPDDLVFYATTTTTEPVTLSDLDTAEDFLCDPRDATCE